MNHYCTYFDRRYALAGFALWTSLQRHDPGAVLWVLTLDREAFAAIRAAGQENLRAVPLSELESADPDLAAARPSRSWVEYVFTLSPAWPRFLLARHPEIEIITYLDADLAFFSSPAPIHAELGSNDVLIVGHRFPSFLQHLESRGRFNVGVLCFRNNAGGRACLEDWRARCLEWCHDRIEAHRYADQKYLDAWPGRFPKVVVSANPGVNLAPWNWMNHRYRFESDRLLVDGSPLIVYHCARFRLLGPNCADSGQLEYGIMPLRLRSWIYGRYWELLDRARMRLTTIAPDLAAPPAVPRGTRSAWKTRALEFAFGPRWRRFGPWWISGRLGLGQFSGRALVWLRHNVTRPGGLA